MGWARVRPWLDTSYFPGLGRRSNAGGLSFHRIWGVPSYNYSKPALTDDAAKVVGFGWAFSCHPAMHLSHPKLYALTPVVARTYLNATAVLNHSPVTKYFPTLRTTWHFLTQYYIMKSAHTHTRHHITMSSHRYRNRSRYMISDIYIT